MFKAVLAVLGLLTVFLVTSANYIGVCYRDNFKIYSTEEAIELWLLQAVESAPVRGELPDIKTAEKARRYISENPDCCVAIKSKRPIARAFGWYSHSLFVSLPLHGQLEGYRWERGAYFNNCMVPHEIEEMAAPPIRKE